MSRSKAVEELTVRFHSRAESEDEERPALQPQSQIWQTINTESAASLMRTQNQPSCL
jgi:hypothetical protein